MGRLDGTRKSIARQQCSWAARRDSVLDVPVGNPAAFAATGYECAARAEIGYGLPGGGVLLTLQHLVGEFAALGLGLGGSVGRHGGNSDWL